MHHTMRHHRGQGDLVYPFGDYRPFCLYDLIKLCMLSGFLKRGPKTDSGGLKNEPIKKTHVICAWP